VPCRDIPPSQASVAGPVWIGRSEQMEGSAFEAAGMTLSAGLRRSQAIIPRPTDAYTMRLAAPCAARGYCPRLRRWACRASLLNAVPIQAAVLPALHRPAGPTTCLRLYGRLLHRFGGSAAPCWHSCVQQPIRPLVHLPLCRPFGNSIPLPNAKHQLRPLSRYRAPVLVVEQTPVRACRT